MENLLKLDNGILKNCVKSEDKKYVYEELDKLQGRLEFLLALEDDGVNKINDEFIGALIVNTLSMIDTLQGIVLYFE